MNNSTIIRFTLLAVAIATMTGCATRTVVAPKAHHGHHHANGYVVYSVRPARQKCWRHRGHWDCR